MEIDPNHLPTDTNALQALVRQLLGTVQAQSLKIAELEARIAKLKRLQFGQSSEKIAPRLRGGRLLRSSNWNRSLMRCMRKKRFKR